MLLSTTPRHLLAAAEARPLWDSVLQAATGRASSGPESRRQHPKPTFLNRLSTQVSAFVDETVLRNSTASRYRTIQEELGHHNHRDAVKDQYDNDVSDHDSVVSDYDEEDYSGKDNRLLARVWTSASDQIRTKLEQQFNTNGTTLSGFDWMGAVSTVSTSSSRGRTRRITSSPSPPPESKKDKRVLEGTPPYVADNDTSDTTEMGVLDRMARACVLNLGKIVVVQSIVTWVQNRVDDDWLQQAGLSQLHQRSFVSFFLRGVLFTCIRLFPFVQISSSIN